MLVDALLEADALQLLVHRLSAFDEKVGGLRCACCVGTGDACMYLCVCACVCNCTHPCPQQVCLHGGRTGHFF